MVYVEVRNGNLEKALRVLRKKYERVGLVKELEQDNTIMKPLKSKEKRKKKA